MLDTVHCDIFDIHNIFGAGFRQLVVVVFAMIIV